MKQLSNKNFLGDNIIKGKNSQREKNITLDLTELKLRKEKKKILTNTCAYHRITYLLELASVLTERIACQERGGALRAG